MNKLNYTFVLLDVETTGTEDFDKLVEVAYKVCPGNQYYEERFKPDIDISIEAMSITHITNEMIKDKPKFKNSTMYKHLVELFSKKNTVFVAHNARFDLSFLEREGIKLPVNHICTMKVSHDFDKKAEYTMNNLQYLRYLYGLSFDSEIIPHQAMSDIIVLEGLFNYYMKHYTVEEMIEISKRPIKIKKMPFGKYKGKLMEDIYRIDSEYFKWVYREVKMDENLKYTVEQYLTPIKSVNK